jgi:hypothetical protein
MAAGHLLGAVVHDLAVLLGQLPIPDTINEIGLMKDFLLTLTLQGRIVTIDALLTQQDSAQLMVEQGGDYVLPVKANQPGFRAGLETWFQWAGPEAEAAPSAKAWTPHPL